MHAHVNFMGNICMGNEYFPTYNNAMLAARQQERQNGFTLIFNHNNLMAFYLFFGWLTFERKQFRKSECTNPFIYTRSKINPLISSINNLTTLVLDHNNKYEFYIITVTNSYFNIHLISSFGTQQHSTFIFPLILCGIKGNTMDTKHQQKLYFEGLCECWTWTLFIHLFCRIKY